VAEPSPPPSALAPVRPADSHLDQVYRYVRRIEVRFRDLDILNHVNHVVYLTYVEQVRTQYFYEVLGIGVPSGNETAFVIATVNCQYLRSLAWGDEVDVGWRVTRLGNSSLDYIFELRRGNEIVANGGGVMVNADPRAGKAARIPEAWRTGFAAFEGISEGISP
jgi:acyl-CoA thioester hydrolase